MTPGRSVTSVMVASCAIGHIGLRKNSAILAEHRDDIHLPRRVSFSRKDRELTMTTSTIRSLVFVSCCALAFTVSSTIAGEVRLGDHTFTIPDGFEIELACGAPLVNRPVSANFDEEGRLYVTDSSGFSGRGPEQLEKKTSERVLGRNHSLVVKRNKRNDQCL